MKKIERLISIVMILLKREVVSASELSTLFNVSVRTIQRDIDSLGYANIPIFAIVGSKGGYSLMDEYKFDKRLMTNEDLENIIIALSGFEKLIFSQELQLTIEKIKSMTNGLTDIDIDFSFYDFAGRREFFSQLLLIRQAIRENRQISFDYINQSGEISSRIIDPYKLSLREMRWYVYGYDSNKHMFRIFKIARMSRLELKNFFSPLENVPPRFNQPIQETVEVELELSIKVLDQFIERYGKDSLEKRTNQCYKTIVSLPRNDYGYQFLASFGNSVKIVGPDYFIQDYKFFLLQTLNQYK
jgi:predicted DNA-binding transcriptional regulator YafY